MCYSNYRYNVAELFAASVRRRSAGGEGQLPALRSRGRSKLAPAVVGCGAEGRKTSCQLISEGSGIMLAAGFTLENGKPGYILDRIANQKRMPLAWAIREAAQRDAVDLQLKK